MEIGRFLSIRDFFNYYVAGVIWLLDLALILFWIPHPASAAISFDEFRKQVDLLGPVVGGVLAVALPYVIGFTLSPVCNQVSRLLRRARGDPYKWVTDYSKEGTRKHKGKRLAKAALSQIDKLAAKTFDCEIKDRPLWFFPIRAYIVDKGGAASDLAKRAYDLMNLAESLLLPVPLLGAVWVGGVLTQLSASWRVVLSVAAFVAVLSTLGRRYLRLRRYWVKHTYHAFLVLKATVQKDDRDGDRHG